MYTSAPNVSENGLRFLKAFSVLMTVVFVSTVTDQLLSLYPLRMDDVQWRFEAAGGYMGFLPMFLIQFGIIFAIATARRARLGVRWVTLGMLVLGVIAIPLAISFLLDFVQARTLIPYDRRRGFDLAAAKTGLFGVTTAAVMVWTGWRGWVATKGQPKLGQREKGDGLVVGQ